MCVYLLHVAQRLRLPVRSPVSGSFQRTLVSFLTETSGFVVGLVQTRFYGGFCTVGYRRDTGTLQRYCASPVMFRFFQPNSRQPAFVSLWADVKPASIQVGQVAGCGGLMKSAIHSLEGLVLSLRCVRVRPSSFLFAHNVPRLLLTK